jgi:Predicted UDP-glucose 6-dehydrogenase
LTVIDSYEKCFNNSSCIAILTEWDEFINYNWGALIQKMEKQHLIIDGRNILNKAEVSKVANKFIAIGK